jgi:predicted acetyltransferase
MLFLTRASEEYKDTFLRSVEEFHAERRQLYYDIESMRSDFAGFVQSQWDQEVRAKIRPGRVPTTQYWLIDGHEVIGELSLRHELNDLLLRIGGHIGYEIRPSKRRLGYGKEILRLGLEKARERGLRHVLITCDADNIGSKKIIEYNGGVFENAVDVKDSTVKRLRYWITLA